MGMQTGVRSRIEPSSRYAGAMDASIATLAAVIVALGVLGEGLRRMLAAMVVAKTSMTRTADAVSKLAGQVAELVSSKERDHQRLERMLDRLESRFERHESWHDKH